VSKSLEGDLRGLEVWITDHDGYIYGIVGDCEDGRKNVVFSLPYPQKETERPAGMTAWVNKQGIRFKGVMGFQTTSPKGTLETLLDKLGARIQQSGKRVFMESADEMVVYHTIPDAEAVSILQEFGIEAHLAPDLTLPAR
jgi:hypothetical protein